MDAAQSGSPTEAPVAGAFLSDKFRSTKFELRTQTIPAPEALVEFFADGPAQFVVRGLIASELHKANEAGTRQTAIDAVVKAIATQKDAIESVRRALGMTADTPGEIAKRMEMFLMGCVAPKLSPADVAKIAEVCPIEFYDITNKILVLTGQGATQVKPEPSS